MSINLPARRLALCLSIALCALSAVPAMAGDTPVAIVEDTNGPVPGVAALDLLRAGRTIVLPPKEELPEGVEPEGAVAAPPRQRPSNLLQCLAPGHLA